MENDGEMFLNLGSVADVRMLDPGTGGGETLWKDTGSGG